MVSHKYYKLRKYVYSDARQARLSTIPWHRITLVYRHHIYTLNARDFSGRINFSGIFEVVCILMRMRKNAEKYREATIIFIQEFVKY